jgi:transposase-like protein
VCAELANRGAKDVPIVYCGELSGFPEAIEATLLDEGASPAEVIAKYVEHWQRNYFRGCHCEYHLTGSVCRSACWNS